MHSSGSAQSSITVSGVQDSCAPARSKRVEATATPTAPPKSPLIAVRREVPRANALVKASNFRSSIRPLFPLRLLRTDRKTDRVQTQSSYLRNRVCSVLENCGYVKTRNPESAGEFAGIPARIRHCSQHSRSNRQVLCSGSSAERAECAQTGVP